MIKRTNVALFAGAAILLGAAALFAQVHGQVTPPSVVFASSLRPTPFVLFRGSRIFIPLTINGHQTAAMLDTAASITTVDRDFAKSIGLPPGQPVGGHGTGGDVQAELVAGVTMELGGMRLEKLNVATMDLKPVAQGIGRPINIVLGRDFFNAAVISVDWASGTLQIHSPRSFLASAGAVRLTLKRKGPFNTIPISVGGGDPVEALFDVGSDGTLSLPRSYWSSQPQIANLHGAGTLRGGVGGLKPARLVTLPELTLAGRTFKAVPSMLSEAANDNDPTQMANVGIQLLKQFKVDLDLGNDRVYLTPRADAPPFARDRAGVRFELLGDHLKVVFVSPQGPAAAAGLKAGDEVTAVDGRSVSADYYGDADWTRGPAGRTVALDRADGSHVRVTLQDYF